MIKWFKRKNKKEVENGSVAEPDPVAAEAQEPEAAEPAAAEPVEMTAPQEAPVTESGQERLEDPTAPAADAADEPTGKTDKPRFFRQLRDRLHKTRDRLTKRVDRVVLGKKVIDDELLEDLEEALITSDLGVRTSTALLERVADKVRRKELTDPAKLHGQLQEEIRGILDIEAPPLDVRSNRPFVIMVAGVNGVGKTTTIGKLANIYKREGLNVLLIAGDTFRAAAIEQLCLWGERIGVPVVKQKSGSDPSAVVFDGIDAALSRAADVVIVDTAGRMHTQVNLMEELKKVHRVLRKKIPTAPHELLLVLDATTGQNALSQARLFQQALGITGLVLTKLDGTAKGGIVVGICDELKIPVRFIGIGEGLDDLRPFDSQAFAEALF